MADRLFLSYTLRGFTGMNMLRHFEKLLRVFPFSPKNPANPALRIYGVAYSEATLLEQDFSNPLDISLVLDASKQYLSLDCAYELDAWWGLWQFEGDWTLRPARVLISCFGPQFQDADCNLRIDFGLDEHYLPSPDLPGSAYFIESNLKGMMQVVHSIDDALAVEKRLLHTESGENFANKLIDAVRP
jgi:hypothetical protein